MREDGMNEQRKRNPRAESGEEIAPRAGDKERVDVIEIHLVDERPTYGEERLSLLGKQQERRRDTRSYRLRAVDERRCENIECCERN